MNQKTHKSSIEDALERIRSLSLSEKKDLMHRTIKAQEELGELSEAVLAVVDAPGMAYKNLGRENVKEEACDVLQVVLSICFIMGMDIPDIASLLLLKADKWEKHQSKI